MVQIQVLLIDNAKFLIKVMKKVTQKELINNIKELLDEIIKTGIPLEIDKNGKLFQIIPLEKPVETKDKLKNLTFKPDVIEGNPDDLVNISWEQEVNIDLS